MSRRQSLLTVLEQVGLTLLLLWVAILPLPFGSNVAAAAPLTTTVPAFLAMTAAVLRLASIRQHASVAMPAFPLMLAGAGLFCATVALQLLPLPRSLLANVSPASAAIWARSEAVLGLAGAVTGSWFPISVDPPATARELMRLLGLVAAAAASALLVRTHGRRLALVAAFGASALFQAGYAVHEAALGRYAIWGWKNTKIFGRITGTYVNPNHFAHYLAIVTPLLVFVLWYCWRSAAPHGVRRRERFAALLERFLLPSGLALFALVVLLAAILLAQSRGALLAAVLGGAIAAALAVRPYAKGRRRAVVAGVAVGLVAVIALFALVNFLGVDRTVRRFAPNESETTNLVGRRIGISAAMEIWRAFPLFGSGAGTFSGVVVAAQRDDLEKLYQHAHNDYAEIAATTGALGVTIAMITLFGIARLLFTSWIRTDASPLRWRRRAFQMAALASLLIAMVHALFDFNFFIPANAASIAVIVGAALAPLTQDIRTRL